MVIIDNIIFKLK